MNTNSFTGSLAQPVVKPREATRRQAWRWRADLVALVLLAAGVLGGLSLVYRVLQPLELDIGGSHARAYLRGFDNPEKNESYTYAFSRERAQVFLPGAGGGYWEAVLRFDGVRPTGTPPAWVNLTANDASLTLAPANGVRLYHLLAPATHGDLDLRLTTNAFPAGANDPRLLGIPLDRVTAHALHPSAPLRAGLLILALAVGLYTLGRRLALRPSVSALIVLATVALALWSLAEARLLLTVGLVRWLVVLAGLHVALWPLRRLVRAVYERAGAPLSAGEEAWLWRIFAVATLVKLGGILYPHAIIFDQAAHVLRMNWILDGRFLELYRPGYTSYMGDTVGLGGGQFPYSPLWYLIVVPFNFLGLSLPDATNGLSALMDVSKLFPIHLIARVTLRSRRTALFAAALYNLIPMPYFLLSWGNYPTQFGLWASLLATAFLVVNYDQFALGLRARRTFWIWVGLMALAILSYTVLGVFSISLVGLIGLLGLFQRGGQGWKRLWFIVAGIVVAELVCFAIYHVQFAHSLATETLPAIVTGTLDRLDNPLEAQADPRANAWANFQANNQFTFNHFTSLVLVLTAIGGFMVAQQQQFRRWWPVWVGWAALFGLYSLVSAYIADMVLKHVFIVMPLVCIWTAVVLDRWWRRGIFGRAATIMVMLFLVADVVQKGYVYVLIKRHF